ncbi:hypothetical protein J8273_7653 [Carpediemonas membranifera]|uniref:Uncharacterized protein n=1 Tax=Carpediemonas membranifera TaxID=201153 RepID=A0A8J6E807_9EUKA|nr:hypothetical protein J8273_7653 [Carpediemonas membranifera]|eukprot:KAG9391285.1 hypothetical protein J8273_7653 [Carpediemonas membranifera]
MLIRHSTALQTLRMSINSLKDAMNAPSKVRLSIFDRYAIYVAKKAPSLYASWVESLLLGITSIEELDLAFFVLAKRDASLGDRGDNVIQFTDTQLDYAIEKVTLPDGQNGSTCRVKWIGYHNPTTCPATEELKRFAREVEETAGPARAHKRATKNYFTGTPRTLAEL